jgi:hypothetical protein
VKMELGDRRRLFKNRRVSNWCDFDCCAFDGIGCNAEPGAQHGGMSRRVVMLMLRRVGSQLRVYDSAERHKPECESTDCKLSNPNVHRPLSKSRCLYRLIFLNPRDSFIDLLFC